MSTAADTETQAEAECQEPEDNGTKEQLEESDRSPKTTGEVRKTWGFRRTTIAKRDMPVEAVVEPQESRGGAVRRSGRQSKRTDKLEEFLSSTAKRAARRSGPSSIESGDPPSQTPTDVETASEASFDGNADAKATDDKSPSPERRTRSGTRKPPAGKARTGRMTRSSGGGATGTKDDGSSENDEDSGDDTATKDHSQNKETKGDVADDCPKDDVKEGGDLAQVGPDPEPEKQDQAMKQEEKKPEELEGEHGKEESKRESEKDSEDEGKEKPPGGFVKRGPIRTYTNKKKVTPNKSGTVTPAVGKPPPAPAMKGAFTARREPNRPNAQPSTQNRRSPEGPGDDEEDDDSMTTTSTTSSSSSSDSEEAGYDPNALYCICRQKHNKRYTPFPLLGMPYI